MSTVHGRVNALAGANPNHWKKKSRPRISVTKKTAVLAISRRRTHGVRS